MVVGFKTVPYKSFVFGQDRQVVEKLPNVDINFHSPNLFFMKHPKSARTCILYKVFDFDLLPFLTPLPTILFQMSFHIQQISNFAYKHGII